MTIVEYVSVGKTLYTYHYNCRACESGDLVSVLDLGSQPLANGLIREDQLDAPEDKYPLHLMRCARCGLCQLSIVVNPDTLYGQHYPYRSGFSETWVEHCRKLAEEIGPDKKVLDIGCLDGVLLMECEGNGCEVTGVDPSGTSVAIKEFWSRDVGERFAGQFDVIVAQNVLGHVDDARGFLEGIKLALKPDGYAVIECPWIVDLLAKRAFDTIYHEHLSYWGARSLRHVGVSAGLYLYDVRHFPAIHGGTLRYYLSPTSGFGPHPENRCERALTVEDFERFRDSVRCEIQWWTEFFSNVNGRVMAGYGASAKFNVFLNALSVRPPLVGIYDDNPTKWNLYSPGWHYPILAPTKMTMKEVEVLIVGSPNCPEIEAKARELGFTGEVRSLWRQ